MYFPIASSTFLLEGKKGSQARVWYKVMCRRYSIVFLENASFWFVLASSSRRTPFVPIHGMSYPRGDTFLIPAHPVGSVCLRSVADAYTYIYTLLQIGDMFEMTRIGFIVEWRGNICMTYTGGIIKGGRANFKRREDPAKPKPEAATSAYTTLIPTLPTSLHVY